MLKTGNVSVQISLNEDGTLSFHNEEGDPFPARLVTQMFAQQNEHILAWLENCVETFNADTKSVTDIHLEIGRAHV